jgi:hypothetical protein
VLDTVVVTVREVHELREAVGDIVDVRDTCADRDMVGLIVLDRLDAGLCVGVRVEDALRLTEGLADPVREMAAEALPVRVPAGLRDVRGDVVAVRLTVVVRVAVSVPTAVADTRGDLDADMVLVAVRVGVGVRVDVRDSRGDFVADGDFVEVFEISAVRVPIGVLVDVADENAERVPVLVRVDVTDGNAVRVRVGVRVDVRDGSAVMEGSSAPPANARSQFSGGISYSCNGCGPMEPRIQPLSPGENPARAARSSKSFILMRSRKPFLGAGHIFTGHHGCDEA